MKEGKTMEGSELVIIGSLCAILVLLRFYRRPEERDETKGRGPVRSRRSDAYAVGSK